MNTLQIPILFCFRCKTKFIPKINPDESTIIIPVACPQRDCRSKTWNIPNDELDILNRSHRNQYVDDRYGRQVTTKKVKILEKYKPKKKQKMQGVVCAICDIFYHDSNALKRHQSRRHTGLCKTCFSSNVLLIKFQDKEMCQVCFEVNKK